MFGFTSPQELQDAGVDPGVWKIEGLEIARRYRELVSIFETSAHRLAAAVAR
jgi:hypothetical protein